MGEPPVKLSSTMMDLAMNAIRIEDVHIEVPRGRVFVRWWRPGEKTTEAPVVLLHDSLGCVDLWRDFPEELARHLKRPVVAYDRLGFGRSTKREGLPSLDFIAEEAEVFFPVILRELGITRISLFGHSVGGAMAVMIAALDGGGVIETVVTEAAQAFVEERTVNGIQAAEKEFASPEEFAKLTKWHGDKAKWVLEAWTKVWLDPDFESWSLDRYLPNVECPVLAIHGDSDEFGSAEFPRRITSGVAGRAETVILEGCGHVPHRERPNEVLSMVCRFLTNEGGG